jgi:hypothetical protein
MKLIFDLEINLFILVKKNYKIPLAKTKRILYLHPLKESWQSGRMRQS